MRQLLIDLLKGLEHALPPDPGCHYALHYAQYGNDESGWEDRLGLSIRRNHQTRILFLDEDDTNKAPPDLIHEIVTLVEGLEDAALMDVTVLKGPEN